jgi:hypothetical protein
MRVSDYDEFCASVSYWLLEAYLGFVQLPANPLEVGADIEEGASFRVEAGEDSLFPYRYPQVWSQALETITRERGYIPLRMMRRIHSCSTGVHCWLILRKMGTNWALEEY